MEKQHLTYFKIENFKRFDSFEMDNLGQFNLIVGDNNVGKTSVLEALTFDEALAQWRSNLISTISFRGFFNYEHSIQPSVLKDAEIWSLIFKETDKPIIITMGGNIELKSDLSLISYRNLTRAEQFNAQLGTINPTPQLWLKQNLQVGTTQFDPQLVTAYLEDSSQWEYSLYTPFIAVNLSYGADLVKFFYEYFNVDKLLKKELESSLVNLIPNLEEVRIHKYSNNYEMLCVTLTDSNSIYPLVRFGDGTVKTTRILMEVLLAKNRRLIIDEIGSGIHFTRLIDYWKTIIQLCAKYNVQLFATTHSLECQRAFVDALEDSEMQQYQKDARNITLLENKEGEVQAVTYDFEQFEYALNIGFNTRGGVL
ncbi:AAA family ATPase [Spirosoma panaciterrae]|uniref:AAA family ATPase n=1 Tax=Spirosoma panaciterrae TaxID=496058 RepID=UPI000362CB66|nr:AAA family ATPase [Spirosoma panaciterrae]